MPRRKGQTNKSIKGRTIQVNPSYSPLFPFTINNQIIDEMRKFTGTETQPQPVPEEYRLYINNLNYPVGSVFMTIVPNITPFDILGIGTWEQVNSDYTIRTSSSNQAGSVHQGNTTIGNLSVSIPSLTTNSQALSVTIPQQSTGMSYVTHRHTYGGNSGPHTLTIDEIPSHKHMTLFQYPNGNFGTGVYQDIPIMVGAGQYTGGTTRYTSSVGGDPNEPSYTVPHRHYFEGTTDEGGSAHDHTIDSITVNGTGIHSHHINGTSTTIDMSYINVTYWIRIA